jgi:hypothetical protein
MRMRCLPCYRLRKRCLARPDRTVLLLLWQERRLIGIQLHVEGGEQRRRPGVIGHQREINQSAGTEVSNAKVNLKEIRLIPLSQVGQYVV